MDVEVQVKQSITELFQTKREICTSNALSCRSTIQSQSCLSRTWPLLHVCVQHTLKCENPWGLSKVDGFMSVHWGNAHKLDQHFNVIFLQPTHVSHSPTSDTTLSDQMWLTSSGAGTLNSSITPSQSFFYLFPPLSLCCHLPLLNKTDFQTDVWRDTEDHVFMRIHTLSMSFFFFFIALPWIPWQSSGNVFHIH